MNIEELIINQRTNGPVNGHQISFCYKVFISENIHESKHIIQTNKKHIIQIFLNI